jgi:hypothetical protein
MHVAVNCVLECVIEQLAVCIEQNINTALERSAGRMAQMLA